MKEGKVIWQVVKLTVIFSGNTQSPTCIKHLRFTTPIGWINLNIKIVVWGSPADGDKQTMFQSPMLQ